MNKFQIHFKLQNPNKIIPFGEKPDLSLHWYGLTDGILWLSVGEQIIYEYSAATQKHFKNCRKYNDYYIARFLEDFFGTFAHIGKSIPKILYDNIDRFSLQTEKWLDRYADAPDTLYDRFYFNEYLKLYEWYSERTFDSGHLVGGPNIGCFRCDDLIKILWASDGKLDDGSEIWSAPHGCFEISYREFISSVTNFLTTFFDEMDKQVAQAVDINRRKISLDKQRLLQEHAERKRDFFRALSLLENPAAADWNNVLRLYAKMRDEIEEQ